MKSFGKTIQFERIELSILNHIANKAQKRDNKRRNFFKWAAGWFALI